jgi:hypothetical protein
MDRFRTSAAALSATALVLLTPQAARAQHDMASMAMPVTAAPLDVPDTRDGSGTAWLPDAGPMRAAMTHKGPWMLMAHGLAFGEFVRVTGARGDDHGGSINWLMGMARRPAGGGAVTLRAMLSLEPFTVGKCGYPDLLQSGESCDGAALHDRQHPHDLFMELAASYRRPVSDGLAIELYAGAAGEPALGPAAYPHRLSAARNPIAPISHHWLDATHISFGVATGAIYGRRWKAEVSAFNGREPDDSRYGFDLARLDSWSSRAWWLPTDRWALQVSTGHLTDAEHDHHGTLIDVDRTTASATYHRPVGNDRWWAATAAWGRNAEGDGLLAGEGLTSSAALVETSLDPTSRSSIFARVEVTGKTAHDLALVDVDTHRVFTMSKLQAGAAYVIRSRRALQVSVGGSAGVARLPGALEPAYGGRTPAEFTAFLLIQPRPMATGHEGHR